LSDLFEFEQSGWCFLYFLLITGIFVILVYPVLLLPVGGDPTDVPSPSVFQVWSSILSRVKKSKKRKHKKQPKNLLSRLRHPAAYLLNSGGESTPPDGESDEFEYMLRDEDSGDDNDHNRLSRRFHQRMLNMSGGRKLSSSSSNFPLV
jgi:hypothetical protein